MKVASVGYATEQGLGILLRDFYRQGLVTDPIIVSNGRPMHLDWFNNYLLCKHKNPSKEVMDCLAEADVALFFETPFNWGFLPHCHSHNTKTILVPMYECAPNPLPCEPNKILNPSLLDQRYFPQGTYVPIPTEVEWRQRTRAEHFIHNAGHLGLKGRNGTQELLDSLKFVKSPLKLTVRVQDTKGLNTLKIPEDPRLDIRVGSVPYEELWTEGDVFIFPEKHNGLSLPLQEARASGMLVMCSHRFPMTTQYPTECMIPIADEVDDVLWKGFQRIKTAIIEPRNIATTIDTWYGRDITDYSYSGKEFAKAYSWETLKPLWGQWLL